MTASFERDRVETRGHRSGMRLIGPTASTITRVTGGDIILRPDMTPVSFQSRRVKTCNVLRGIYSAPRRRPERWQSGRLRRLPEGPVAIFRSEMKVAPSLDHFSRNAGYRTPVCPSTA